MSPNRSAEGSGRLARHPRDVAHLPPRPRFTLTVDVDVGSALSEQLRPLFNFVAYEIVHHGSAAHQASKAGRQIADRADVLLELRGDRAFDGPVTAVVDARGNLVDHRATLAREELDGENADVAERFGKPQRRFLRLRDLHGDSIAAMDSRAAQDAFAMLVFG